MSSPSMSYDDKWCEKTMREVAPGRYPKKYKGTTGKKDEKHCITFGDGDAVDEVWLTPDSEEDEKQGLYLKIYPGNVMSQATRFIEFLNVDQFVALLRKGWALSTFLQFRNSFQGSWGVRRRGSLRNLTSYFTYWQLNRQKIRRYRHKEFRSIGTLLCEEGILSKGEQSEFQRKFVSGNAKFIFVCPGVYMRYYWRPQDIEKLGDHLKYEIRKKISEAFFTWGQVACFEKHKNHATEDATPPSIPGFSPEFEGDPAAYRIEHQIEPTRPHGVVINCLNDELSRRGFKTKNDQKRDLLVLNKSGRSKILFDAKTDLETTSIYGVLGQLMYHSAAETPVPQRVAVLPGSPDKRTCSVFRRLKVDVLTYKWKRGRPAFFNLNAFLH